MATTAPSFSVLKVLIINFSTSYNGDDILEKKEIWGLDNDKHSFPWYSNLIPKQQEMQSLMLSYSHGYSFQKH